MRARRLNTPAALPAGARPRLLALARPRLLALAAVCAAAGGALTVAGATDAAGPRVSRTVYRTPVLASLSWFAAMDAKDARATIAHFAPGVAARQQWPYDARSNWPVFMHVHCRQTAHRRATATTLCTFHESSAPDVGNPDTFWSIELVRRGRRWLISDYGQG